MTTLSGERFHAKVIEAGQVDVALGDGHEFVLEVEGTGDHLHIPCTAPVAREMGAQLYRRVHCDLRLTLAPAEETP